MKAELLSALGGQRRTPPCLRSGPCNRGPGHVRWRPDRPRKSPLEGVERSAAETWADRALRFDSPWVHL